MRAVQGSTTAGEACCRPALVVAAQTGGHVATVERVAVTAVRAR